MVGPIVKNVRWRVTAAAALVVLPLVALACSSPGGGGVPGAPPVPRPDPTSTLDRAQSLIDAPIGADFVNDPNTVTFDMACGGSYQGHPFSFPQPANSVNIIAPTTVTNGQQFDVWITPGDWTVPSQVSTPVGLQTIASVTNFILVLPLSTALSATDNVQFVDAVMTGGGTDNGGNFVPTGFGYPQVQKLGSNLVYTLDGPMKGGDTISLPRVKLTLIANGPDYAEIDYGMSFMKVTAKIPNQATHTNTAVGVVCKPSFSPFNSTYIFPANP
jgi:dehydratase